MYKNSHLDKNLTRVMRRIKKGIRVGTSVYPCIKLPPRHRMNEKAFQLMNERN